MIKMTVTTKISEKRLQEVLVASLISFEKFEQLDICSQEEGSINERVQELYITKDEAHTQQVLAYLNEWKSLPKREKDALLELHYFDDEMLLNDIPNDIFNKKRILEIFGEDSFKEVEFYKEMNATISKELLVYTK